MKFRKGRHREEPEINFIPLIDVMLVILIFLMATTTYSRFAELKINLPTADAEKVVEMPQSIQIAISATGQYSINNQVTTFGGQEAFAAELRRAAGGNNDPMVIINADSQATHQTVVNVMEAARLAGYSKLTFATQTGK
ncbi:ExbD/TolR family protein [Jeongeupia naejangsanensis]|uniref:Biopolymer transporter ExbD n=1 Tax=Jeongeupia naejangsanensis TaxID=613195 RepID=A0ABS2BRR3_9NEIS|nr:biopolymer transporter ExbD [Jeongeupia naejangsanensis]MBM3117743.1 biopolymer transporter ExbD [Jeongeupia naejangsanensis]